MRKNRLNQIMDILEREKRVSVGELVDLLQVSDMTVRRDLSQLESSGDLLRYHGGAYLPSASEEISDIQNTGKACQDEKGRIGKRGRDYLKNIIDSQTVNSVAFASGSTVLEMIRCIDFTIPVSVIADSLEAAGVLSEDPGNTVIMLGGVVNRPRQNTIGYLAEQMLDNLTIDCIFMGTSAIDEEGCVYCYSNFEASILKKMLTMARHTVVLADSSKIGRSNLVKIFRMDERFTLITDEGTEEGYLEGFGERGVEVITV